MGRAKNVFAQECLREICYLTAKHNMVIKLVHKPGCDNRISDMLSRWHLGKEYEVAFMKETEGKRKTEKIVTNKLFKFSHTW